MFIASLSPNLVSNASRMFRVSVFFLFFPQAKLFGYYFERLSVFESAGGNFLKSFRIFSCSVGQKIIN